METIPRNESNYLDDINPQNEHLPDFVKVAAKKQNDPFRANVYDKYNHRDMILKCTHLSTGIFYNKLDSNQDRSRMWIRWFSRLRPQSLVTDMDVSWGLS